MNDMSISILQLIFHGLATYASCLFQCFDPLLRILYAAGPRPFI